MVGIVSVSLRTARALMFTTYLWQPRRLHLWRTGRICLAFHVGIIRGRDRDRCPLYLIGQGLATAPGRGRAVEVLVASDWLRPVTRGGGWRAAPPVTERCAADVS